MEKITGSSLRQRKHIFLESIETNKISLEWIVAYIFQDEELENVHCFSKGSSHCNKCIEKNKKSS